MSLSWIHLPRAEGQTSKQAHADLPTGSYERELGRDGFYGPATHMHHRHPPTAWQAIDGPLRPRAFDTHGLAQNTESAWQAANLLSNADVKIRCWTCAQPMSHLLRNADGDELLFVHQGAGALFCDYGHIEYREGDFLILPRGTLWRLQPTESTALLMIEACNERYGYPDKGMLGQHAVYDPAVLETPKIDAAFLAQQSEHPWQVQIKRHDCVTLMTYPFNPLDAIGWHGTLSVLRLNWRDIRPVMSDRYHIPPSVHTTFASEHFVVCTFCPRPMESDPGALSVPFYHSNEDYDEVIFYHKGDFFSRDHIHPGMLSLHPCGFPHGPHPKAYAAAQQKTRKRTDEVAVMIDARNPLRVSECATDIEWGAYWASWQ